MQRSTARPRVIRYEQAVYGSFPFWDKGYAMLAQSPGCRPEWLASLRSACQRFGERPAEVSPAAVCGLFTIRLAGGPWMIVGVSASRSDDRGRPGPLAFHALFVTPRDYRRLGSDPFALAGALRDDWTAASGPLAPGIWPLTFAAPRSTGPQPVPDDPLAERIAAAMVRGRRVALESPAPIDALARQVWSQLPEHTRRRATVATWAFSSANRFDLVGLPHRASVALDASYCDPADLDVAAIAPAPAPARWDWLRIHGRARVLLILGIGAALLAAWFARVEGYRGPQRPPAAPATIAAAAAPARIAGPPPPDRTAYRDRRIEPDEQRQAAEALRDLAAQFGLTDRSAPAHDEENDRLMTRLAEQLRYRGPTLGSKELARLASAAGHDHDHEAELALRWHDRIARFADDRPLPADFALGPLAWQLDTLAWSFHLDPDNRRSVAEVVHALGRALASDLPLNRIRWVDRYPALAAYRDFLSRLPRR